MTTYTLEELTPDELAALERYREKRERGNDILVELTQLRAEVARLTAEVEAAWIPVTERLPERGHYLAAGAYSTGYKWVDKMYFGDDKEWHGDDARHTTHWRPLPAHPAAKE